ncbi:hypothetical protein PSEUDO9AG_50041 [Pseudomonas sp. 9Ag]|nr:hypothetical protein PSEUDO9AG_50041 [Pseudomonas sp. 9Ag]
MCRAARFAVRGSTEVLVLDPSIADD